MVLTRWHLVWSIYNRIILFIMTWGSCCMLGEKVLCLIPNTSPLSTLSWTRPCSSFQLHSVAHRTPASLTDGLISLFISFFSSSSCSAWPEWRAETTVSVFVVADKCILRGGAYELRMRITRVSSGTSCSVVLLCFPGQGQTEGETGGGRDRGIEKGVELRIMCTRRDGRDIESNQQQNSIVWSDQKSRNKTKRYW